MAGYAIELTINELEQLLSRTGHKRLFPFQGPRQVSRVDQMYITPWSMYPPVGCSRYLAHSAPEMPRKQNLNWSLATLKGVQDSDFSQIQPPPKHTNASLTTRQNRPNPSDRSSLCQHRNETETDHLVAVLRTPSTKPKLFRMVSLLQPSARPHFSNSDHFYARAIIGTISSQLRRHRP